MIPNGNKVLKLHVNLEEFTKKTQKIIIKIWKETECLSIFI